MPLDPNTGLYVDQVYHTPGPGGNPIVGGLMDAYNAMQGNYLYGQKQSSDLINRMGQISQNPDTYQNISNQDQGMNALNTLGLNSDTVQGDIEGSPVYKYHQALKNMTDFSPQSMMRAAAQTDPEAMAKMWPAYRAQMTEEGKNRRTDVTQYNKDFLDTSKGARDMFDKLVAAGYSPQQASDVVEKRIMPYSAISDEDKQKIKDQLLGSDLPTTSSPVAAATIGLKGAQAGLAGARTAEIEAKTPAEVANLWALAGDRASHSELMKVHASLGKVDLEDRDILNLAKSLSMLSGTIQKDEGEAGLASPLVQRNPEVVQGKKDAIAATKPILAQIQQRMTQALQKKGMQSWTDTSGRWGNPGETWVSADGISWTNLVTGKIQTKQ